MKKRIFGIILVSILIIFVVGGCGKVNVPDSQVNSDNNDEENIQETPPQKTEDAEDDKHGEEDKPDSNDDTDVETGKTDENSKDIDDETDSNKNNEDNKKPENEPESDDIKVHRSGNNNKKLVALTFDDGPESEITPQILDVLDEYNIKATFFIVGQNAAKHTDVLKDIHDRGHEIGNHSWSHKYLPKISKQSKKGEILKTEELLMEVLGEYAPVFRPPYGAVKAQDKQLIDSLGYKVVNWSVDTRDWAGTSNEQIMKYVKQQLGPGGIILMHNSGETGVVKNTVNVLPTIIDWVIEQGYEFTTVTEILD